MSKAFLNIARNKAKMRLFMLTKLPSAWFSGVKLQSLTEQEASVSVPYKWFSTNPFRSTYFACLAMAAEMSTGVLAMLYTYKSNPPISMLVLNLQADFIKKATGITTFTCHDGEKIRAAVAQSIATGEAQTVEATSTGTNENGETVAVFRITWTFKAKKSSN